MPILTLKGPSEQTDISLGWDLVVTETTHLVPGSYNNLPKDWSALVRALFGGTAFVPLVGELQIALWHTRYINWHTVNDANCLQVGHDSFDGLLR